MQSAAYAVLFSYSLQITVFLHLRTAKIKPLYCGTDTDWLVKYFADQGFDLEFAPFINPR